MTGQLQYPPVRRDETICDNLHGLQVADPYRWLEDPDDAETKQMIANQNEVTNAYLARCAKRDDFKAELTALWNYAKYGVPRHRGKFYYYFKNDGLQNQPVLYQTKQILPANDEATIFLNPNEFREDGTAALTTMSFNEHGSVMSYGVSESGSDWFNVHFKQIESTDSVGPVPDCTTDVLHKVKFSSISWAHDHRTVFYGSYQGQECEADGRNTEANLNQKLYCHRLGQTQADDVLCLQFPDHPRWRIDATVSDCGRYLICCPQEGTKNNLVYFTPLTYDGQTKLLDMKPLQLTAVVTEFASDYDYVGNIGAKALFLTNCGAPNFRLVAVDFDAILAGNKVVLEDVIAEDKTDVIEWISRAGDDKLVVCYMHNVNNVLKLFTTAGQYISTILDAGEAVAVVQSASRKGWHELYFKVSSLVEPGLTYRVDLTSPHDVKPQTFRKTNLASCCDISCLEVEQVFYTARDGTSVPMYVAGRGVKSGSPSGRKVRPCLLYGYGGFNISLTPSFSISQVYFMTKFDGVVAIPNIRGGGEYGERWHNAGRLQNKQNCFNDFQDAAQYLIDNKYTESAKLVINGGSNGGLLVAACMNQRPDLFGAGVAAVGVMDMVRFHKFTIGHAWCSDYGNPDDAADFKVVIKYSPLHNVPDSMSDISYPAVLLTAADHDDRVVPSHSLKFIAQLQHVLGNRPSQVNPLLVRVDTKSGHGAGKPTTKKIDEVVDVMAFIANALHL